MAGSVEKVYAQALLEIGREDGTLGELNDEISSLDAVFSENPEFVRILNAPTVTEEEKITLIKNVFEGRISPTVLNFLCVIAEKNRVGYISGIAKELRNGYYEDAGIAEVTVTSAVQLKEEQKERLKEKLSAMFGKSIILREKTDPSIMGGMIVRCGDSTLDGSVKTKLENMHKQIKDMIAG